MRILGSFFIEFVQHQIQDFVLKLPNLLLQINELEETDKDNLRESLPQHEA